MTIGLACRTTRKYQSTISKPGEGREAGDLCYQGCPIVCVGDETVTSYMANTLEVLCLGLQELPLKLCHHFEITIYLMTGPVLCCRTISLAEYHTGNSVEVVNPVLYDHVIE